MPPVTDNVFNIFAQIRTERDNFRTGKVKIVPGVYEFSQYETLKRIELYYNSKFETGDRDSEGYKKFFYQVSEFRCSTATKAIDLDRKNLTVVADDFADDGDYWRSWFMSRELRQWLKRHKFGKTLNEIADKLPVYGSVVMKKTKDDWNRVELQNLILADQSVAWLKDTAVTEIHHLDHDRLEKMRGVWDEDALNAAIKAAGYGKLEVFERYGLMQEKFVVDGGSTEKLAFGVAIVFGIDSYEATKATDGSVTGSIEKGTVLFKSALDKEEDFPYQEIHWKKRFMRWLGVGDVEALFEDQHATNETVNMQQKGLVWSAKRVFHTTGATTAKNLLMDTLNGEVVSSEQPVTVIPTESRFANEADQVIKRWSVRSDQATFSYDVLRGENLPASTPLGLGQLLAAESGGYFDRKREDFGLFLGEVFLDIIIPSFKKEKRREHAWQLTGDEGEISKFDEAYIEAVVEARRWDMAQRTGFFPDPAEVEEERERIRAQLKKRDGRPLKMPDRFYEDFKYHADIVITGEQVDIQARTQTINFALQAVSRDPTILVDPVKKAFFFKMLDLSGINPHEFDMRVKPMQAAAGMMPGGVPAMGAPGQMVPQAPPGIAVNV